MSTHNTLPHDLSLLDLARTLRKNQTRAEMLMWQALRNRNCCGYKFFRQRIISSYIADFYCHELRLVIEIDGSIHDSVMRKEYDSMRTVEFESYGLTVIRYSNNDIVYHLSATLNDLKNRLQAISKPL